jgi:adenosine deaminase
MTTHLHVHLEPNERKRRQMGAARRSYDNPVQFFSEHAMSNPERLAVDLGDLELFIDEFHAEQRAQGVSYAELRISPRRFLCGRTDLADVLRVADQAVSGLENPAVRLILLLNRDSSAEFVDRCEGAVADGLPGRFVGVDLAGDEVQYPDVGKFESFFLAACTAGLGVTVHAGEFGDAGNVWRALDQLGATRVGHAVAVAGCRQLARRLREDQVLVEVSVTSNVALGAVPSLQSHPLPLLLEYGIPTCLNTDVPLHLGTVLAAEWQSAARLVGEDQQVLDAMETSARLHCFRDGRT